MLPQTLEDNYKLIKSIQTITITIVIAYFYPKSQVYCIYFDHENVKEK
jgi:hypothetical protein